MKGQERGWNVVVGAIQHEVIMSAVAHTTDPRAGEQTQSVNLWSVAADHQRVFPELSMKVRV